MNKEDEKMRIGLWMGKVDYEQLRKDCKDYNFDNMTDLTVNKYILKLLRDRK